MFSTTKRHLVVALGLIAVAGVTGASAAGYVTHTRHAVETSAPVVSGDLGEVVVHAPGELGEVVVFAPHDLGNVLVEARRSTAGAPYLAEVLVTAPRDDRELVTPVTAEGRSLVAAR